MVSARSLDPFRPILVPALALVGVGLLGFLQAAPWPSGLVDTLSPRHGELHRQASALVPEGATVDAELEGTRLSVAAGATRRTALGWLAWAALLAAAAVAGRHATHRRVLMAVLLVAAVFVVLYGMQRWLRGSSEIWGVEVPGNSGRLRGTFVNPDHFAVFLEINLALAFALVAYGWHRARRALALEARLLWAVPPVLLWIFFFAALAFSGSRAGLAAAFLGLAAQILLVAGGIRQWKGLLLGSGLAVSAVAAVGAVGARYGFGRWLSTSPYEVAWSSRMTAIRSAWDLWLDFFWTGSGLGTFREAFPLVQPPGLRGTWLHGHSDPLELAVTAGIAGLAVAAVGFFALGARLRTVYREGWRTEDRLAAVAALGALVSVGAHECVDFGLTMPANALALVVLCGAATAARLRNPRLRRRGKEDDQGQESG